MTPVLWVILLVAAVMDLRHRRIPNQLIGVGLVLGGGAQFITLGWTGLLQGLLGAAAALVVLIAPFALRTLGGGDVKLAMVVGIWTSISTALSIVLLTAIATGIIAALLWIYAYFQPNKTPPKIPVAVPLAAVAIALTSGAIANPLVGS